MEYNQQYAAFSFYDYHFSLMCMLILKKSMVVIFSLLGAIMCYNFIWKQKQ